MYYMDREGHRIKKTTSQDKFLKFVYTHTATRVLMRPLLLPAVSRLGGKLLNTKVSAVFAGLFARTHGIDLNKYEKQKFDSYNDFFTRKLKPDARLLAQGDDILISPCDAKLTIFPITNDSRFLIKQGQYTVQSLLRDEKLAKQFEGGILWQLRLSVDDYHRYIYPVSGRRSHERTINGVFHTVQPIALEHCPVYKENTRKYCIIKTKEFGTILMMEVGAMMVGRITNHEAEPGYVTRGEEKGYFEFGGSTIILLTQKGAVLPRKNILYRSARGEETRIRQGEKIGKVNNNQR